MGEASRTAVTTALMTATQLDVRMSIYPSKTGICGRNRRLKAALPADAELDHRPTKCAFL